MEKEERIKARELFYKSIDKSEDDLEKKITYISAGGLALSISFIDKIVDLESAVSFYLLIIAWIFLALTLAINLSSILVSRSLTMKSSKEFDNNIPIAELTNNISKRNKLISYVDLLSLLTLFIGIAFLIIFCSINLKNQNTEKMAKQNNDWIEKGRIIPTPDPFSEESTTPNTSSPNIDSSDSSTSEESN